MEINQFLVDPSHLFDHIRPPCSTGIEAIVWFPKGQWSKRSKTGMCISYLYNANAYTGKIAPFHWSGPMIDVTSNGCLLDTALARPPKVSWKICKRHFKCFFLKKYCVVWYHVSLFPGFQSKMTYINNCLMSYQRLAITWPNDDPVNCSVKRLHRVEHQLMTLSWISET